MNHSINNLPLLSQADALFLELDNTIASIREHVEIAPDSEVAAHTKAFSFRACFLEVKAFSEKVTVTWSSRFTLRLASTIDVIEPLCADLRTWIARPLAEERQRLLGSCTAAQGAIRSFRNLIDLVHYRHQVNNADGYTPAA